jgi:hypothetical protein
MPGLMSLPIQGDAAMFSKGVSTRSCFVHGHPLVEWEGATWEVMAFNVGELHYFEEDQEAIDETNYEVVTDEIGSDYATWSLIMDLNYRRVNRHDYDGSQDALYVTSPHGFFGSIDQFHELSQSQWLIKVWVRAARAYRRSPFGRGVLPAAGQ